MPRADTGTFNRLLTSLGLILMAAALVVPYFYFRSTDTLEIERDRLARLTPTAKSAIEGRQNDIAAIQPFVLPMALALIAIGVCLLVWGAYRLRSTQDRDDREAEARTIMAEAGVRDLTPQEQEDKIAEEDVSPLAEGGGEGGQLEVPVPAPVETRQGAGPDAEERRRERLETARRIERSVSQTLSHAHFDDYQFRAQVAVGQLKLDGLFLSGDSSFPDVVLESRVAPRQLIPLMQAERVLARVARYQAVRSRSCRGWLVLVIPESPSPGDEERSIPEMTERLNKALNPAGYATVIHEAEIPSLPGLFPKVPRLRPNRNVPPSSAA